MSAFSKFKTGIFNAQKPELFGGILGAGVGGTIGAMSSEDDKFGAGFRGAFSGAAVGAAGGYFGSDILGKRLYKADFSVYTTANKVKDLESAFNGSGKDRLISAERATSLLNNSSYASHRINTSNPDRSGITPEIFGSENDILVNMSGYVRGKSFKDQNTKMGMRDLFSKRDFTIHSASRPQGKIEDDYFRTT